MKIRKNIVSKRDYAILRQIENNMYKIIRKLGDYDPDIMNDNLISKEIDKIFLCTYNLGMGKETDYTLRCAERLIKRLEKYKLIKEDV